jgi:hypothetical protein
VAKGLVTVTGAQIAVSASNYKSISPELTVAKQNVRMKAIDMNDCENHGLDTVGRPFTMSRFFTNSDVLHVSVPEVGRHIMSASCAAQNRFQTVQWYFFRKVCTVLAVQTVTSHWLAAFCVLGVTVHSVGYRDA